MKVFRQSLSDILVNAASICIAFTSATFAGYMIFYGGQDRAQYVLDEPQSAFRDPIDRSNVQQRIWTEDKDRDDQLTTSSLRESTDAERKTPALLSRLEDSSLTNRYVLRTVFQGTALIEIRNELSSEIWPATEGSYLPGAGKVVAISKRDDRWQVVTTERIIEEVKQ